MSQNNLEYMPAISVDIAYGDIVDSFEVDIEKINSYLIENGTRPEDIANLSINFSADHVPNTQGRLLGYYEPYIEHIEIHRYPEAVLAHEIGQKACESAVNLAHTETLVHELTHHTAKSNPDIQQANTRFRNRNQWKLGAILLGSTYTGFALDLMNNEQTLSHRTIYGLAVGLSLMTMLKSKWHREQLEYLELPEEKYCREQEIKPNGNMVNISLKQRRRNGNYNALPARTAVSSNSV